MLPHIIFGSKDGHRSDKDIWRSWTNPNAPDDINTSGITQPPMLAEAIVQIGEKLSLNERRNWYKTALPSLVDFHQWLYNERDPHNEGLVLLIHPWESGLDNSPPWISELRSHQMPFWIRVLRKTRLTWFIEQFRRDIRSVPAEERPSTEEGLGAILRTKTLKKKIL